MNIFTIGHSTRTREEFSELLTAHGIDMLVDVRSYPGSRHCPQFNTEVMPGWLPVPYVHLGSIGGRRRAQGIDPAVNAAWTHASFKNYADYATTPEFDKGLSDLEMLTANGNVAYMCAEAVWWKCHRRIISDHLVVRGWNVQHIMSVSKLDTHKLSPFAQVVDGELTYPSEQPELIFSS